MTITLANKIHHYVRSDAWNLTAFSLRDLNLPTGLVAVNKQLDTTSRIIILPQLADVIRKQTGAAVWRFVIEGTSTYTPRRINRTQDYDKNEN